MEIDRLGRRGAWTWLDRLPVDAASIDLIEAQAPGAA